MYPISSAARALFEAEQKQVLRITGYSGNPTPVSLTITDANVMLNGFSIDRFSSNSEKLELGTAISSELTLKLDNRLGQYNGVIFEGAELFVEIGIADWSQTNPTIYWIPCGYFTPDEQPRALNTITIHALDRMMKFDAPMPLVEPWTDNLGNVIQTQGDETIYFDTVVKTSFPLTVAALVQYVCTKAGVPFDQDLSTLPNYDFVVTGIPNVQKEITYRNIVQWCAALMGCNAWIDWSGKLRFSWYGGTSDYLSTTANRFSSDMLENDVTVTGIVYKNLQGATLVYGDEGNLIDVTGNYLISDDATTPWEKVANAVKGYTYRPFSASATPAPYLWPMDTITFRNKYGIDYTCALTNVNLGLNASTELASKGSVKGTTNLNGTANQYSHMIERNTEAINNALRVASNAWTNASSADEAARNAAALATNARIAAMAAQTLANQAQNSANGAQSSANSASSREQRIYRSAPDGTSSLLPNNTWVTYSQPAQGVWTTTRPEFDPAFPVLFVALQRQSVSQRSSIFNLCDCTTPVVDLTTTVIDGGNITTGSINANFIQTGVLTGGNGVTTLDLVNGNFSTTNATLAGTFKATGSDGSYTQISDGNIKFRFPADATGSTENNGIIRMDTFEDPSTNLTDYRLWIVSRSFGQDTTSEIILSTNGSFNGTSIRITYDDGIIVNPFGSSLRVLGDFIATGSKSRNVPIDQFGDRLLYAYETPSPLFGDVGEARIGADGKCYVWFDVVFAQTIADAQYQVFLQRYGNGECWVSERTGAYFIVEGDPGLGFAWEVKAKQRGYEQTRLEPADKFSMKDQAYGEKAALYIENLRKERETA